MPEGGSSKGVIAVLITVMVSILVGIVISSSLISSQDTGNTRQAWSATANTTWTNLQTNIWTAFTLIIILPIIVGAVAILGYIRFG